MAQAASIWEAAGTRRRAFTAAGEVSAAGTRMAEEVIPAGMAVASITADALDKVQTRTDAHIDRFLTASRFFQSHLEGSLALAKFRSKAS